MLDGKSEGGHVALTPTMQSPREVTWLSVVSSSVVG
jgi:hypothetical protein